MPDTDTTRESISDSGTNQATEPHRSRIVTWRSIFVTAILFAIILMAILPPLLNVNRFKHRIVTSISTSVGRPVHLDSVALVLLPFPGFKLENFVVAEEPAFGSEPVIHANSVLATLRISSLWRRKVEFSKISLQEPSINLVHNADGKWNIESILLQAARIPAAPTAQSKPSADPRFPYIEATGARVNIKSGLEKLPFSLTEADFALWLPNPRQWRIRLVAKPTRTDTNASDTGTISLEGTLGHASSFSQIPLEFAADWKNAPLGEASRLLLGHDAGLRGELRITLAAAGTIGSSLLKSTVYLRGARRADFVPTDPLNLQVECQAVSANIFHAFHQVRCAWPPPSASSNAPTLIALTGDLADINSPDSASFEIGTPGLPAATLLNWLSVASPRVPPDVAATGTVVGSLTISGSSLSGTVDLHNATLSGGPLGSLPVRLSGIAIAPSALPIPHISRRPRTETVSPTTEAVQLTTTTVALGAKDPATLEGRFDRTGYSLHLAGTVLPSRLLALASAVPQFGDGLSALLPQFAPQSIKDVQPHAEVPIRLDITSVRQWTGAQTWSKATVPLPVRKAPRHR